MDSCGISSNDEKLTSRKCIVEGCQSKYENAEVKLFKFPKDCQEDWCHNIGVSPEELSRVTRICSRHFEPNCFGKKKLKSGSMPTLNLGNDAAAILIQPSIPESPRLHCVVPGCKGTRPPLRFFGFPMHEERRNKWLRKCSLSQKMANRRICELHFPAGASELHKIPANMYPSLNLPKRKRRVPKNNVLKLIHDKTQQERNICSEATKFNPELQNTLEECENEKRGEQPKTQTIKVQQYEAALVIRLRSVIKAKAKEFSELQKSFEELQRRLQEDGVKMNSSTNIATSSQVNKHELSKFNVDPHSFKRPIDIIIAKLKNIFIRKCNEIEELKGRIADLQRPSSVGIVFNSERVENEK